MQNGHLASGSQDNNVNIWDTETGSLVRTLAGHSNAVPSLAVLQNGFLVSSSDDQTINIWNTETGSIITTQSDQGFGEKLAVMQNGYLASATYHELKIWN